MGSGRPEGGWNGDATVASSAMEVATVVALHSNGRGGLGTRGDIVHMARSSSEKKIGWQGTFSWNEEDRKILAMKCTKDEIY